MTMYTGMPAWCSDNPLGARAIQQMIDAGCNVDIYEPSDVQRRFLKSRGLNFPAGGLLIDRDDEYLIALPDESGESQIFDAIMVLSS